MRGTDEHKGDFWLDRGVIGWRQSLLGWPMHQLVIAFVERLTVEPRVVLFRGTWVA